MCARCASHAGTSVLPGACATLVAVPRMGALRGEVRKIPKSGCPTLSMIDGHSRTSVVGKRESSPRYLGGLYTFGPVDLDMCRDICMYRSIKTSCSSMKFLGALMNTMWFTSFTCSALPTTGKNSASLHNYAVKKEYIEMREGISCSTDARSRRWWQGFLHQSHCMKRMRHG